MGVKGLTTYIITNRNHLLSKYKLQGGYLVIDGESLAISLYKSARELNGCTINCNCAFGGDYNIYTQWVIDFFENLEKCGVTPLVLMEGGMEKKKMETLFSRREVYMFKGIYYSPRMQGKGDYLLPENTILAFTNCLLERGTKVVRCVFENDPCIAGVAKILNCPVLSLDSDFYIFGVKYISFEDLRPNAAPYRNGYAMDCKIFKVENLLKFWPGLSPSVLPLLAVLLGNDYVDGNIFQNFFDRLGFFKKDQNQANKKDQKDYYNRRIEAVFKWLCERNLDNAVAAILSTLPVEHRQEVLEIIELIVNGYLLVPCEMMEPLCLADEYREEILASRLQERFKFHGKIATLKSKNFWSKDCKLKLKFDDTTLNFDMQDDLEKRISAFADSLPSWFQKDFSNARFHSSFISMMFHRLFVCATQVEDCRRPNSEAMSLNIIRVIDGLLVAGREEAASDLTYVIREGEKLESRQVGTVHGINSMDFPPLSKLRDTPLSLRKQIFEDTLEISGKENLLEDIPSEWRLFIVVIFYWMDPADELPPNSSHIYALLFTMLLGIVDRSIGKSLKKLDKNYRVPKKQINVARSKETFRKKKKRDSIIEALKDVVQSDCLEAANFFIANYQMKETLLDGSEQFDVTVVHAFAQFQCCLRQAIGLNALLGCPYQNPVIGQLYNGTMLYNLSTQFDICLDEERYIAEILVEAPSLLRIVNLLIAKMKMLRPFESHNTWRKYADPSLFREMRVEPERSGKKTKQINGKPKKKQIKGKLTKRQKWRLNKAQKENTLDKDGEYIGLSEDKVHYECIVDTEESYDLRKVFAPKVTKLLDADFAIVDRGRGKKKLRR